MDNLTHSLAGLMLARAGLNRWCPQAAAILILSSSAPDVDVAAALQGSLRYLECHRHATHALAFIPVVAVLPVLVVRLFGFAIKSWANLSWWRCYVLAMLGAGGHMGFDWLNMYGVRILLPFSGRWHQADAMPVIDPWILLVLILAVVAPGLASLVSTEIGARARPGRGWAIFALAFFVLYTGARMILHGRAVAVVESRLYAGSVPLRVAAWPTFASPLVWTGYAETQTFWSLHRVDLTRDFDPSLGRIYYKPEPSPVFEAARRDRTVRSFLEFSQYPLWRAMPLAEPEGATRVEFIDVRFGPPEQKRFTTTVVLDSQLRVLRSEFRFGRPGPPTAPRD